MNQLATLQDTPDFAAMYSVPSTGAPNIARARINRDSNIKFDDKLVTVAAPSLCYRGLYQSVYGYHADNGIRRRERGIHKHFCPLP